MLGRLFSIEALMEGQRNVMIGLSNGQIVYVPFSRAVSHDRTIAYKTCL